MEDFNKLPKELTNLDVESEIVKDYIIEQVVKENWYMVYLISKLVSREVSILIDSNDNIWVDWGTIGRVKLSPPIGSTLPFKLWVHTHPSNTAYWSITDRNSLEMAKGILEKALVLGENGLLSTTLQPITSSTVDNINSNLQWTEEEVTSWFDYYCNDMPELRYVIYHPEFLSKWRRGIKFSDDFN
ncbi:MAG: hypothetical protein ISR23_07355 [Candidatus Poseidoniaceae archaeon]|nr:hypothetical protein [Candidatus Poseidoniaceae archaeon]